MLCARTVRALIWMLALSTLGCAQVPNGPDEDTLAQSGVYINEEWQFQISRPDETWGMNSAVFQLQANGLPQVEVWMFGPAESGQFQPTFFLTPDVLFTDDNFESFIADLELELGTVFAGYRAEDKKTLQREDGAITAWAFQVPSSSGRNFMPGDRFWVQAVVHGEQVYVMLGNGSSGYFPVGSYERIASSLVFLK